MSGSLDHSPAHITLELLIQEGLGFRVNSVTPVDWMVFLNKMVPQKAVSTSTFTTDKTITVYDTSAIVSSRIQYNGVFHEAHGVQIALRLDEYEEVVGYTKAKTIQDYLDTQVNRTALTIDDTDYLVHSYSRTTDVVRLNNVLKDDHLSGLRFTLNFLLFVTKV